MQTLSCMKLAKNSLFRRIRCSHTLRIGGVKIQVSEPQRPEIVPQLFVSELDLSQECLSHLRWIAQKDSLKQDCFMIGPPSEYRRRLVLAYAELTGREVEFLMLSQDTTEADLKQRREIVHGSAIYVDQAPVRAAIEVILLSL